MEEDYKAWYIPSDKLKNYPNHPDITSNEDAYFGFTLKEPILLYIDKRLP